MGPVRLVETVPDQRGSGELPEGTTRGTEGREGSELREGCVTRGCCAGAVRARSAARKIGFREGSALLCVGGAIVGVLVGVLGLWTVRVGSGSRGWLGVVVRCCPVGGACLARSAAL